MCKEIYTYTGGIYMFIRYISKCNLAFSNMHFQRGEGTGGRKIMRRWKGVIGKKRARENGMGIGMR